MNYVKNVVNILRFSELPIKDIRSLIYITIFKDSSQFLLLSIQHAFKSSWNFDRYVLIHFFILIYFRSSVSGIWSKILWFPIIYVNGYLYFYFYI